MSGGDIISYAGGIVLLVGALFGLTAAIGVVRLPDLLTRMHAASKAGAVGAGLILISVAMLGQDSGVAVRAILGIIFLLLTTPVAAHLLAKASMKSDLLDGADNVIDDLRSTNEKNKAGRI